MARDPARVRARGSRRVFLQGLGAAALGWRRRLRDQSGDGAVRADAPLGGGGAPARQAGVRRAGLAAGRPPPDRSGHPGLPRRDRRQAPPGAPIARTCPSTSRSRARRSRTRGRFPAHTAMNRGLLQYLENEAQFAFVMGHEMGHVAARHSAARQSRATLGSAGVGILGVAGDVVGLGGLAVRRGRGRHPAPPPELRPGSGAPGRPAGRALHGARRLRSRTRPCARTRP